MGQDPCEIPTRTQVADTAADIQLLAKNSRRKGASVVNTSTAALLIGEGSAAVTLTNYSVRLVQYAYYETPYRYTGELRGIWESDPGTGGANITEFKI